MSQMVMSECNFGYVCVLQRKSESFITLNDDTLKSVTENSFDFLDEEGDRIGSVVETATLKLTSVDMKSIYGQFNSNTNYILDIVNDDEI